MVEHTPSNYGVMKTTGYISGYLQQAANKMKMHLPDTSSILLKSSVCSCCNLCIVLYTKMSNMHKNGGNCPCLAECNCSKNYTVNFSLTA